MNSVTAKSRHLNSEISTFLIEFYKQEMWERNDLKSVTTLSMLNTSCHVRQLHWAMVSIP